MSTIHTYSGKDFDPLNPDPDLIDIADIAHSLSLKCRFNGHVHTFYSVAEHSVRVARYLWRKHADRAEELGLWGLLHDGAEAYLTDMPAPVKRQMPEFRAIENALLTVIMGKFGLAWPEPKEVKKADYILLATEARDLLPTVWPGWEEYDKPHALEEKIVPWTAKEAEEEFLRTFAFYSIPHDNGESFNRLALKGL